MILSLIFFPWKKSSHFVSFVCFCVCLQMTGSCLWMSSRPSSLTARWTRKNWRSFLTPSTRITPGQQRHATAVSVCLPQHGTEMCVGKKKKKNLFWNFHCAFDSLGKKCVYIFIYTYTCIHFCLVDSLTGTILLCNMLESQIILILK